MSQPTAKTILSSDRVSPIASLHVEVIADFTCPFCFLGKRRLDSALQAVVGPREVSWYPWQLNPEMAKEGMTFDAYLASRFGSVAAITPVLEGLQLEGAELGIDFRFDKIKRVPNTLRAHQLMYLAELQGIDRSVLADDLMAGFFSRGEDLGARKTLLEIGVRHGLDAAAIDRTIDDSQATQVVQTREGQARASGIAGVPGFLLNRRLLIVGAQDTDNIINAFDRAMFGEGADQLVSPALN